MSRAATRPGGAPADVSRTPWTLLRAGLLPALAVGAVVIVAALVAGGHAVAGAAVGTALSVTALAAGPLLLRLVRESRPELVFALAVGTYILVVVVLALAYALLSGVEEVHPGWLGGAVLGCTAGWLVGQAVATYRLRVLAFGDRMPPG